MDNILPDFDALSVQVLASLAPKGEWDSRRWKTAPFLRKSVELASLPGFNTLDEKIYAIRSGVRRRPSCVVCDKPVKLKSQLAGFRSTCSVKCAAANTETRKKKEATLLIKYGGHHTKNKEWSARHVLDAKRNGSYAKGQKTFAINHGVDNRFQLNDVKVKIKQTNLDRYGVENPMQSAKIKAKSKYITVKRHGAFFNPTQTKQTNLDRYGVENAMQSAQIQAKSQRTTIDRHGAFFNPVQTKQTNLDRYGVENPMQNKDVANKASETTRDRYEQLALPGRLLFIEEQLHTKALFSKWEGAKTEYRWIHKTCSTKFTSNLVDGRMPLCPRCKPRSKPQQSVRTILEDLEIEFIENDRSILGRKELDFWLPKLKIGIEVNGRYWHRYIPGNSTLLDKTVAMEKLGYQLLHFWDHEIIKNAGIIRAIIASKLGKSRKIGARTLDVDRLASKEAAVFYTAWHLQGKARAKIHLGLKTKSGELLAAASFSSARFSKNGWELVRFCSGDQTVVGGLSRLVQEWKKLVPNEQLISYADRRISKGKGYTASGFQSIGVTKPGYFYWKGNQFLSRQQAMKHRLPALLGEKFDGALSETENMESAGWARCFDCGNLKLSLC